MDQKVLGLNPTGCGIQLVTVQFFIAQSLPSSLSWYDLNNAERDVKHQVIINCKWAKLILSIYICIKTVFLLGLENLMQAISHQFPWSAIHVIYGLFVLCV